MKPPRAAHPLPQVGFGLILLSGLLAPPLHAQPPQVTLSTKPDRTDLRLADSLRVTFAVEGPAPLRIDPPEPALSAESNPAWRIRPAGPAAVEKLPGDRERWSRVYRLDPYLPADPATITFAPVKVNGTERNWPEVTVRVRTNLTTAKAEDARPVTGIEQLPPAPPGNPDEPGWVVAGFWLVGVAAVLLTVLVRRAFRKPPPLPPGEWASAAFDRLERDGTSGRELADRLADVLRGFVERRFGLPASKLTTAELIAEGERAGWAADTTAELRTVLERCDRAKFAGETPDEKEAAELLGRAREWVRGASPAVATAGL